ncbi:PilN domain-containing protein [Massilia yuzhufengensis]|uniref:Type IV pilus assembly protein PilN n=1 Tax=Massilia yuzhufengensis TaxID=1164594 RepID=A0A1I1W344_9BURK|nr:PilN domain-containing protein [Massilia yuzhufengensis]SFD87733.1 type IV pilus assembly protein PilN [Massilia yuzhufengensis]
MIRINLLPHREAKRKQKQSAFVALLALGGLVGAAVVLMVGGYNASRIAVQNERNLVLKTASAELDKKIGEIKTLEEEIEALKARQQAVEDLQGDRNQPVYLLDELVRQTPEGVYLKSFRQEGQKVTLSGYAQSQERVAELLRNVSGTSPWLERPNLTEVKVAALDKSKTGRKVVEFQMDVAIKRLREQEEADGAKPGAKGANVAKAAQTP